MPRSPPLADRDDDPPRMDAQRRDKATHDEEEDDVLRKRETRAGYRALEVQVQATRSNILDVSVDDMSKQVEAANLLFQTVKGPSEAILDSRVLMAASDAGALKARQLKVDANAFDVDEFLLQLGKVMTVRSAKRGREDQGGELGQGTQEAPATQRTQKGKEGQLDWERVGKVLAKRSKRVAVMDFMYGPMNITVKKRKERAAHARLKPDESQRVRADHIQQAEIANDPGETSKMAAYIAEILAAEETEGTPLIPFLINPHSFSQSVENVFYFSFLVRDGKVAIEVETSEDSPYYGDAITFRSEPATEEDRMGGGAKHQLIFELTVEIWEAAIKAYDITESHIPTRDNNTVVAGIKLY